MICVAAGHQGELKETEDFNSDQRERPKSVLLKKENLEFKQKSLLMLPPSGHHLMDTSYPVFWYLLLVEKVLWGIPHNTSSLLFHPISMKLRGTRRILTAMSRSCTRMLPL